MRYDSPREAHPLVGVGVVGAGHWGRTMLRTLHDNEQTRLLHVCDRNSTALNSISRLYADTRMTQRFDDMLVDDDVDAVYIATPPATHAELASAALRAGKHVLVEKPLATSLADAGALSDIAARHDRTLMVGHTFLYSPPVLKLKELLTDGTMGDVFYIESQRVNWGRYQDAGVLWDLAPHDLSIILFWLGEVPCGVSATGRSVTAGSRPDVVFINLDFPSGVVAQIHVSWLSPVKLRRILVSGSRRMAIYDDGAGPEALQIFGHDDERRRDMWTPRLEKIEPLRAEWDHFLDCIHTGNTPRSDALSGSLVVKILETADRALQTRRRETIDWDRPVAAHR